MPLIGDHFEGLGTQSIVPRRLRWCYVGGLVGILQRTKRLAWYYGLRLGLRTSHVDEVNVHAVVPSKCPSSPSSSAPATRVAKWTLLSTSLTPESDPLFEL